VSYPRVVNTINSCGSGLAREEAITFTGNFPGWTL
jgi:hypothetical protein